MSDPGDSTLARLRHQAEKALERTDRPGTVMALLDRIVELAVDGSEPALFAHRHLAELRLEQHPWRAALHLRKVIAAEPHDDVTYALMGLCQALLGNYRSAISAYERALRAAPDTPWYHHNLGHLLDVALAEPRRAEPHLRKAYELEPHHDEIIASLAHCLARLDKLPEAEALAQEASELCPESREHRGLLKWIAAGAKDDVVLEDDAEDDSSDDEEESEEERVAAEAVRQRFEALMADAGFTDAERSSARRLWSDFSAGRRLRIVKPAVYAAAVEYAIALVHGHRASQAAVAKRYGVAKGSVSSRYCEIRDALELQQGDPRYAYSV
jgi:tetratricopeptide (TPR) repeat protein